MNTPDLLTPDAQGAETIVTAYREKILYALAIIGAVMIAPFAIYNFFQGHLLVGVVAISVVIVFVADAVAIFLERPLPVPIPVAFALIVVALAIAIRERGLLGIFWSFPAILLFHFVLERRIANLLNVVFVVVVGVVAFTTIEKDVALRLVAGQVLTIIFTNIFSYAVETGQRKEAEQRRRLGLLVRTTRAGFYQWERETNAATYSGRLKEMIGRDPDEATDAWPPVESFMHPEDRERHLPALRAALRDRSVRNGVRRYVIEELRLTHANGGTLWVHMEGLFMHAADGQVTRFVASLVDVTDRKRREDALRASHNQIEVQAQQLRDQNEALRGAIRVREEVERIARHDIKTPLNTILAVPRLLREEHERREGRPMDAREEKLLGMVEAAAYRMLDMVNLSVDIYRMEQGEYRFSPRVVDLVAVLEAVGRDVQAHADTKGVRIEVQVEGAPAAPGVHAYAWAEELLCYSILANLLKNAVEASPDGATVRAAFSAEGGMRFLRLHNEGMVPASVREKFFEKYATYGKVGGFGLGTYSAQLMARVQKGDLAMRTAAAEGTTLELSLPLPPEGVVPAAGVRAGLSAPSQDGLSLPALRVLIVDDDEFNVAFVRGALPTPPLEVATAINGRAAVEAARRGSFDLVFMDLEMPVMNGFDALQALRAIEAAEGRRRSVVVAFSSFDDDAIRRRCQTAGFDAYLSKPAPRERLHEMLRQVAAGQPLATAAAAEASRPASPEDPVQVDPDLAAALPKFLETRRALVAELAQAAVQGERRRVGELAHKLAGGLSLYGFAWASAACRDLRAQAEQAPLEDLARRAEALRAHLDTVRLRMP